MSAGAIAFAFKTIKLLVRHVSHLLGITQVMPAPMAHGSPPHHFHEEGNHHEENKNFQQKEWHKIDQTSENQTHYDGFEN